MEMYFNCGEYTKDAEHTLIEEGFNGGIIGSDGTFKHGHNITNSVSVADKLVIGKKSKSKYDETIRQYNYYKEKS